MAKNQTRRLKPSTVTEDIEAHDALKAIAGYTPANPAYTLALIEASRTAMEAARTAEAQATAAAATARDNTVAKEWEYHNMILGAKDQIKAQFGSDSNELQAMGLKKKSERKTRTSKAKPPTT